MKKKKNTNGALVILAVLALFIFASPDFSGLKFIIAPVSVLSLSQVDYQLASTEFTEPIWLVNFALSPTSTQEVTGIFSASDINAKTDDKDVENGFTFGAEILEQKCTYGVSPDTDNQLYRYEISSKIFAYPYSDEEAFIAACTNYPDRWKTYSFTVARSYYPDDHVHVCVRRATQGILGHLHDWQLSTKTQMHIDDYTTIIETSGDAQITSANILDDENRKLANVKWVGNLGGNEDCPQPLNNKWSAVYASSAWRLTDFDKKTTYNTMETTLESTLNSLLYTSTKEYVNGVIPALDQAHGEITLMNRASDAALVIKTEGTMSGSEANGVFSMPLDYPIAFPTYTLLIKASHLGLVEYSSTPKIISATTEGCFKTGTTGYMNVAVENTGNTFGNFQISTTCTSPISPEDYQKNLLLDAGDRQTITIPVVGSTAVKAISTCTVTVFDTADPSIKDVATIEQCIIKMDEEPCTPNWVVGNWGECVNNIQSRSVVDSNKCYDDATKPATTQSCGVSPPVSDGDNLMKYLLGGVALLFIAYAVNPNMFGVGKKRKR